MAFEDPGGGGAAPGAKPKPPPKQPPPASPLPTNPGAPANPGTGPTTTTNTPTFPGIPGVLSGDPSYQQLLAFDTAASGQDLATMNANIARMNAYYGNDNDPLSILGRVYQAYQDRNRVIANTLAGHGMIQSGETGFQGARATLDYQRQELDARMKLEDYIQGLQQAFAQAQRQQKFNEMQASWQAVQNWLNGNPPTSTTTPGTPPAPAVPPSNQPFPTPPGVTPGNIPNPFGGGGSLPPNPWTKRGATL